MKELLQREEKFEPVSSSSGVVFYNVKNFSPKKVGNHLNSNTTPIVVSAANHNHRAYALYLIESLRQKNVAYKFYDLGNLGFGNRFDGKVSVRPYHNIPCKPLIMLEAAHDLPDNQMLVWIDSDAILIGDIRSLAENYDFCVTLRKNKSLKKQEGWVNAGVIAIRINKTTKKFLKLWARIAKITNGDQSALNLLLFEEKFEKSLPAFLQKISVAGVPAEIFNNYEKIITAKPVVRHFKADIRKNHPLHSFNNFVDIYFFNKKDFKKPVVIKNEEVLEAVEESWDRENKILSIPIELKTVYLNSFIRFYQKFGRFPDLQNPVTYNEKIQWLKLFEINRLKIICSDKIEMRNFISSIIGPGFTPEIYNIGSNFETVMSRKLPDQFVLKASHDSGTVYNFGPKGLDLKSSYHKVKRVCDRALSTHYGWSKGEWPYSFLTPRLFVEENLASEEGLVDYKFHCVDGLVRWVQVIWDRDTSVKEAIFMRDGRQLDIHFDHFMMKYRFPRIPERFTEAIELAERIAQQFSYVRIDTYIIGDSIYVGELTFFPRGGYYPGLGEVALGAWMNFKPKRQFDVELLNDQRWRSGVVI